MNGPGIQQQSITSKRDATVQFSIDHRPEPPGTVQLTKGLEHRAGPIPVHERAKVLGVIGTRLNQTIGNTKLATSVLRKVSSTQSDLRPMPVGNSGSESSSMLMRPTRQRRDPFNNV